MLYCIYYIHYTIIIDYTTHCRSHLSQCVIGRARYATHAAGVSVRDHISQIDLEPAAKRQSK